ncbi:MAG TPA: SAM-dependent methyltransferase, partial [Gammaproteobacteria bacterium]|nr:SAM-dependent methyltransferase [Gammaproteobacteria bacterium]
MTQTHIVQESASFRDPDGFVFQYRNAWYRFVDESYQEHYDHLIHSGLYERLIQERLLLPHQEISEEAFSFSKPCYKILKPSQLEFVSYPYEWCFSQLKEAGIATLKIQKIAHQFGMCLKDASAFNIQFYQGNPTLIDTLSFHRCTKNTPWIAMGQFYRHFLWPLLAMANIDVTLNKQFLLYPDGFKHETLKPWFGIKTWFKPSILLHVHLHGIFAKKAAIKQATKKDFQLPETYLPILLDRIISLIEKLTLKQQSVWKDYYHNTNYEPRSFKEKELHVVNFIQQNRGKALIDFGANNGHFSILALKTCAPIFALDFDALALEALFTHLNV